MTAVLLTDADTDAVMAAGVCTASVTVGVDAHDAGTSATGVELFACERGTSTGADGETDWCTEHGVPWIALTDAWAGDSSLGLRSWIEEHWPNEGDR